MSKFDLIDEAEKIIDRADEMFDRAFEGRKTRLEKKQAQYRNKFHMVRTAHTTIGTIQPIGMTFKLKGRVFVTDLSINVPFLNFLQLKNIVVNGEEKVVNTDGLIDCFAYSPANIVKQNPFTHGYGELEKECKITFPIQSSGWCPPGYLHGWSYLVNVAITGEVVT